MIHERDISLVGVFLGVNNSYAKTRDPATMGYFDEETMKSFTDWNCRVMAPGELDRKTKELVAVACAYMIRCPYCIEGHAKAAVEAGASKEELAEVIRTPWR